MNQCTNTFVESHRIHLVDDDGSRVPVAGHVLVLEEAREENVTHETAQVAVDDVVVVPITSDILVVRTLLVTIVTHAHAKRLEEPPDFGDVGFGQHGRTRDDVHVSILVPVAQGMVNGQQSRDERFSFAS